MNSSYGNCMLSNQGLRKTKKKPATIREKKESGIDNEDILAELRTECKIINSKNNMRKTVKNLKENVKLFKEVSADKKSVYDYIVDNYSEIINELDQLYIKDIFREITKSEGYQGVLLYNDESYVELHHIDYLRYSIYGINVLKVEDSDNQFAIEANGGLINLKDLLLVPTIEEYNDVALKLQKSVVDNDINSMKEEISRIEKRIETQEQQYQDQADMLESANSGNVQIDNFYMLSELKKANKLKEAFKNEDVDALVDIITNRG